MAAYLQPLANGNLPSGVGFNNTTDPRKIAANQRQMVQANGDILQGQDEAQFNQNQEASQSYSNYLDPIEQQMASGNGGYTQQEEQSLNNYIDPTVRDAQLQGGQTGQNNAVSGLQSGLNNAINPSSLEQSPELGQQITNSLEAQQGGLQSALQQETSGLSSAIDPSQLGLSSNFTNNYLMTPEEQQNIVSGAGISAGLQESEVTGNLQRAAQAAGVNPMGVAAEEQRNAVEGAAAAGDAMTQARIQASNAAAQRQQTNESMRLGAAQDISGREMTAATTEGQQAAQNVNTVQEQGQQMDTTLDQERLAANQYLTGAQLQAATTGGEAGIQNAQTETGQTQQENQYDTTQGLNSTTGMFNTRLQQQDVGLGAQTGQEQMYNQNAQNAAQRQNQVYATQTQGTNQAGEIGLQASQTPSTFDKVLGGVAGGLSALGGIAKGKVIDKPTVATVGEQGPEAIVPLNKSTRVSTPGRRAYGEPVAA